MVNCCKYLILLNILVACMSSGEEFDWKEQEKNVEEGCRLILSENSNERIKGIELLTENKTYSGLRKLVNCWIKEKDKPSVSI